LIIEDQLNRPLEAYKVFEEAAATSPGLLRATEALADAAYRSQNWHRARELYDEIWRAEPSRPRHDVSYRRGLVHETLGDYQTADLCYSHAISLAPDDRASLEGKARVALARDDIPGAIGALQGLAKLITVDEVEELSATRCKLGELHLRAGDHAAARACLESALSLDPSHAKAIQTLLSVYEQIGEFEGMASLLERLIRLTSNPLVRASLLHYRAEVLGGELGNEDAAVDCLLKAYDLAPNYPPTLWRLIDYYWERDDLPAVAEMGANLRQSTDLSSATPDVRHVRLAVVAFVEEKKPQVGEELLGVALGKADLQRQVLLELGRAVDKGAAAAEVLALLRRTDPENRLGETLIQVAADHPENRGLVTLVKLAGQPR